MILLQIDNNEQYLVMVRNLFSDQYSIHSCNNPKQALQQTQLHKPDVILLNIDVLGDHRYERLKEIIYHASGAHVIVQSAYSAPQAIVRAIHIGATDYITTPIDVERLNEMLGKAQTSIYSSYVAKPLSQQDDIVGNSPAIHNLRYFIAKCAETDAGVVLYGATGTGKDLAARMIHKLSDRKNRPYVPINCGAIPDTLFETEMFGTERGAYTDAIRRMGAFEQSHRGVLFLDEIGELSLHAQVKLLRVLEDNNVRRIGSSDYVRIDTRVIAATNRELRVMVKSGQFRADLYYRLHVLSYTIPPLKERREDIPLLAWGMLRSYTDGKGRFTTSAMDKLSNYEWVGNIRELRNCVQRAVILSDKVLIGRDDITFV